MPTAYDTWTNASYTTSSITNLGSGPWPVNTTTACQSYVDMGVKKSEINRIDRELDNLEGDMEYFNNQLKEKQDRIEYLEGKVTELETILTNLQNYVDYLHRCMEEVHV